jgi:hypothetical protein
MARMELVALMRLERGMRPFRGCASTREPCPDRLRTDRHRMPHVRGEPRAERRVAPMPKVR